MTLHLSPISTVENVDNNLLLLLLDYVGVNTVSIVLCNTLYCTLYVPTYTVIFNSLVMRSRITLYTSLSWSCISTLMSFNCYVHASWLYLFIFYLVLFLNPLYVTSWRSENVFVPYFTNIHSLRNKLFLNECL